MPCVARAIVIVNVGRWRGIPGYSRISDAYCIQELAVAVWSFIDALVMKI